MKKFALITGGGIGQALAKTLAEKNLHVLVPT